MVILNGWLMLNNGDEWWNAVFMGCTIVDGGDLWMIYGWLMVNNDDDGWLMDD